MQKKILFKTLIIILILLRQAFSFAQHDIVHGNLIQFNDNGLWCWFQDERCAIDTVKNKLIVGSVASQAGVGYSARNGSIEAIIFDLKNNSPDRYQLAKMSPDDHNAPGFIIRPNGNYIAMYSDHYDRYKNRYRIFDGSAWSREKSYNWETRPGGTDYTIAYNNVYYLSEENRFYDFSRANHRSPNFIISEDMGETWTFGGQLTTNTSNSYNKGYYKYWSNGIDRIDFIFTEQHPRDTLTSIYHGYIQNGKAYKSNGEVADTNIFDDSFIPAYWDFTKIFANGTTIGNTTMYRCWQSDLVRYKDGTIAAIITARSNQSESFGYPDDNVNPQHDFIYCRYNGKDWIYSYLGKAGLKFYSSEADYVGLGALSPNDQNILYISTPYDPRDTTINLGVREIFKGETSDSGKSWLWTPITENSIYDNIRPIVPEWNKENIALLWCRGTYISAQSFDAAVVGIIERGSETIHKKNYIDADFSNTTFEDGTPLTVSGPDDKAGPSDNQWHLRTGVGNNASIFTSAELTSGENTPKIKTEVNLTNDGTYDIWINFWGYADYNMNWRIKAGLSPENMKLFRSMACKQVEADEYEDSPVLSENDNIFLYQAYLGRINGKTNFDVFIDDSAYQVGVSNPILLGDVNRTWYDGISFAKVDSLSTTTISENINSPAKFSLSQNYPNPFNPSTTITFELSKDEKVSLKIYNSLGQEVTTLINKEMSRGKHNITWNAQKIASGIYFYNIDTGYNSAVKKMILLK